VTFGRGGAAMHPLLPGEGLSESLVDPALTLLGKKRAEINFGHRLRTLRFSGDRVAALDFGKGEVVLGPKDAVVLAVTAPVAGEMVPDLVVPTSFRGIVNAHFKMATTAPAYSFMGVIGGTVEWIFVKPGIISTTTSAADSIIDEPAEGLAARLWADVQAAFKMKGIDMPPCRVVKEKRATFAATPEELARRPGTATRWSNLFLAGDWTDTGWPATIEGAIRSGFAAADAFDAQLHAQQAAAVSTLEKDR